MPESVIDQEQTLIMNKEGEPYGNKAGATAAIRMSSSLDASTHEVVEVEGGYAIGEKSLQDREGLKVDTLGKAKPTPKQPVVTNENQPEPKPTQVMCPTCGHKAGTEMMDQPCENPAKNPKRFDGKKIPCSGFYGQDVTTWTETFHWVTFSAKSNPNDFEDVDLSVNGEQLKIKRQERVCIPGRFLEAARNATRPNFKKVPGKNRKVFAPIMTFPFTEHGEGSLDEFNTQKREGTKQMLEDIKKYGPDGAGENN